jgi:deoxyribonuclease-4
MTGAKFGPGGNSEIFYASGFKSTVDAPAFLKSYGLDAYEYEAGNGLRTSDATLLAIGKAARENGIAMSLHTPYFISLSNPEPEKMQATCNYIKQSIRAAELLGAVTIVIHCGGVAKMTHDEGMQNSKRTLSMLMDDIGHTDVRLGLETMGKVNQLGTLDEVLELCELSECFYPVVDFGHLNARHIGGYFTDVDSYRRVFSTVAEKLSDEKAKNMHCHFSKIEFTDKGEKKHLTFSDTVYGPDFEPLMEAIALDKLSPTIICESAGTMAEDALAMKKYYINLL